MQSSDHSVFDLMAQAHRRYEAQDADGLLRLASAFAPDGDHPSSRFREDIANMLHNLSFTCHAAGNHDAALTCSTEAARLLPESHLIGLHRSYLLLARRAYREAWDRTVWQRAFQPAHPLMWDGVTLIDRRSAGGVRGTVQGYCELVCLPFAMGLGPEEVAMPVPCLRPPANRTRPWREVVAAHGGIPVGLMWADRGAGSPRSLPFSALRGLMDISGIRFFCLQSDKDKSQIHEQMLPDNFTDLGVHDLQNTAAIMKAMRLIIAPDCGLAHLAGALGVETWMCLSHACDWRWGNDGTGSDWYPTATLFRQDAAGRVGEEAWTSVLSAISGRLRHLVLHESE
ncbi:glycosyltransferase family 9 protein [Azospirillum thiophilum]|uniref:glycosyltransferase family 9 protein n=1 Tax=Azospirillum thiophilum TaxID=528244 RepID=UPI000AA64C06|nr:glycosyltransferase family 9 protein [Azospirillum thiophilum]